MIRIYSILQKEEAAKDIERLLSKIANEKLFKQKDKRATQLPSISALVVRITRLGQDELKEMFSNYGSQRLCTFL